MFISPVWALKAPPSLPPAVVRIRPVSFSHFVQVMFAFNDVALVVESSEELLREFLIHKHSPVFVVSALCDHPLHGQETPTLIR